MPDYTNTYSGKYSPIGIDLGSAQVKMLQLKQERGKVSLSQKSIFPTPEGFIVNGKITDSGPFIKQLRRAKQESRWHGNRVNLCLNNQVCYLRTVQMPEISGSELDRAMHLAAEKYFPLAIDQAVISYVPIKKRCCDSNPVMEYLLVAVNKEFSDVYTSVAVEAGFNPVSLDIKPLAMLRSVKNNFIFNQSDNISTHIFIDCGNETTIILITNGREYLFHRSLNFGLVHFIRTIQARESINRFSAQGRTFSKDSLVNKGLLDMVINFSRTIAQTLEYFFEQENLQENELPSTISVCGGCIFIPGLAEHLQNDLKVKLHLYNPLHYLNDISKIQNNSSRQRDALFTYAHGLALRGWSK